MCVTYVSGPYTFTQRKREQDDTCNPKQNYAVEGQTLLSACMG